MNQKLPVYRPLWMASNLRVSKATASNSYTDTCCYMNPGHSILRPLESLSKNYFSYFSTKTYVVGTQRNVSLKRFF